MSRKKREEQLNSENGDEQMNFEEMVDYKYRGVLRHKHLSKEQRAAQFMPFAALNGYGEKIQNATEDMNNKREYEVVDESGDSELNAKLLEDESFDDEEFLDEP